MRLKTNRELEDRCINTIRMLSADAVQREFRAPRHADGRGRYGLHSLDQVPQTQSRESAMV